MKHFTCLIMLALFLGSCEKETLTEDYASLMTLKVENNQAEADNQDKIKLVAEFPADFSTSANKTVDFYIYKDEEEKLSADIRLVHVNGVSRKIAEVYVKHNKAEVLNVKAVITINTVEVSKETAIEFVRTVDYTSQLAFTADNDNADADNYDKIHLLAEVPYDFPVIDNNSIDFYISKDTEEKITAEVRTVESGSGLKKIAEAYVKYNRPGTLNAKAVLKTNGLEIAKNIDIHFIKAYPAGITVNSSSLEISPESFDTITITTRLLRQDGVVSLNTIGTTRALDANGNPIGIFINYNNRTDAEGKITNTFTLGNSTYTGPITIIGEATDADGAALPPFILTIFSNQ